MEHMPIQRVAVVGAGTMGRQIALHTARSGFPVRIHDNSRETMEDARRWAHDYLEGRIAKGRMSREQAEETARRITWHDDVADAVKDADLIIEAVVEDLDVKRAVFARLDRLAPSHAILATNSSTIVSSKLAPVTRRPGKVANLHYFNPALVMELVEVVGGPHTEPATIDALIAFAKATEKTPVHVKKEVFGFIANRIFHALANEAMWLLENGYATAEEIDTAVEKGLRHPMGPFRLMDLTGLDVGYRVRMEKYRETGREADRPPRILQEKYERGEWGRKTGRGWYTYDG